MDIEVPRYPSTVEGLCLRLRHALLDDLRNAQRGYQSADSMAEDDRPLRLATPGDETAAGNDPPRYTLTPGLEEMLTWLARHRPSSAGHVISDVIGEAGRNLGMLEIDAALVAARSGRP